MRKPLLHPVPHIPTWRAAQWGSRTPLPYRHQTYSITCYKYVWTQQTSIKQYEPLTSQLNPALTLLAIKRKRYIIPLHTIKTFKGTEVQLHSFLPSAQVGWRWVVDSTSSCFKPGEKFPRYPLKRKLGGPQSWSGRFKEKNLSSLEKNKPQFRDRPH
jgi:hypothetical protein